MAENTLELNKTWQDQNISSLLRQKKADQSRQQADSARLKSQLAINPATLNYQNNDIASTLQAAKQAARADLANNPEEQEQTNTSDNLNDPVAEATNPQILKNLAAQKATGEILKQLWLNIIPSFGLTFILINIYAFAGFLEGYKLFCKPGSEWNIKKSNKLLNMLELAAILVLDFLIFIVILFTISILVLYVDARTNPVKSTLILWELFKDVKDLLLK